MLQINENVGEPFFNRLKNSVAKLTKAGYNGVHLDTNLQMVITPGQVEKHQMFYPHIPLILVTTENCPENIEEIKRMFLEEPIYPAPKGMQEEAGVADILADVDLDAPRPVKRKPKNKTIE